MYVFVFPDLLDLSLRTDEWPDNYTAARAVLHPAIKIYMEALNK